MTHLNQKKKKHKTMNKESKQHFFFWYFVFIIIGADPCVSVWLLAIAIRAPSVLRCSVGAYLVILSFTTGTNEKVNFPPSQSGCQPVSYSAHPAGPTTRQLISHRWRRCPRSFSAHQQVSQSESCWTDNQAMPLGHLVVRSVSSLANQLEWPQSISHF